MGHYATNLGDFTSGMGCTPSLPVRLMTVHIDYEALKCTPYDGWPLFVDPLAFCHREFRLKWWNGSCNAVIVQVGLVHIPTILDSIMMF